MYTCSNVLSLNVTLLLHTVKRFIPCGLRLIVYTNFHTEPEVPPEYMHSCIDIASRVDLDSLDSMIVYHMNPVGFGLARMCNVQQESWPKPSQYQKTPATS